MTTPVYEAVVRAEEVALMLDCSVKTVLRMAKAGTIPSVQIGKLWRFRRSAIDDWVKTQLRPSDTYLAGEVDCSRHPRVSQQEEKN